MTLEEATFLHLVVLARCDGAICGHEDELLERYRDALGLSRGFARRILTHEDLEAPDLGRFRARFDERKHLVVMMVRVAHHDGAIDAAEERILREVAGELGIGPVAFADLVVEVAQRAEHRHSLHRWRRAGSRHRLALTGAFLILAAVLLFAVRHFGDRSDHSARTLADLRASFDSVVSSIDEERLVERERAFEELERTLRERVESASDLVSREEFEQLERELARTDAYGRFSELESAYRDAVVLLCVSFEMRHETKEPVRSFGAGTGFFATPSGHIVTNKHVVRPWLFRVSVARLIDDGYELDEDSVVIGAWHAGSRIRDGAGNLDWDRAYTTHRRTLDRYAEPRHVYDVFAKKGRDGVPYEARYHVQDISDLAVLKAEVPGPVHAILLDPDDAGIQKVDPVMVLGFPKTLSLLETELAETAPSFGVVRKVEQKIFVDAAIISGNSGGPLLGLEGYALGVATTIHGDPSLGGCIPAKHVLPLLPDARELLDEVRRVSRAGTPSGARAALDLLHLARLQCRDDELRGRVDRTCRALEAARDERLARARDLEHHGGADASRAEYEAILAEYGPHWGYAARGAVGE